VLWTLKLSFDRFCNSNEYDEDREKLSSISEMLLKSYSTNLSVAHKKSVVLLMQEATPYALSLGDRGFVFLKECLMPFTSRMPEPVVMLEFFEKQALPENAEDSPYFASLEEFREQLKKLADPNSFKTPLKKKRGPGAKASSVKKVNPRMKLELEGDDNSKESSKGKEELDEEPNPKKKRTANKKKKKEEERSEKEEEAQTSRGVSASPRRKSSRLSSSKSTLNDEENEQDKPEMKKRGRNSQVLWVLLLLFCFAGF
jgi:hypothetical protein